MSPCAWGAGPRQASPCNLLHARPAQQFGLWVCFGCAFAERREKAAKGETTPRSADPITEKQPSGSTARGTGITDNGCCASPELQPHRAPCKVSLWHPRWAQGFVPSRPCLPWLLLQPSTTSAFPGLSWGSLCFTVLL